MKYKFGIFTVTLLTCFFIFVSTVHAFTNSNYYDNQNISIGLQSMASSQLTISLNGDYTLNGVTCKSGTSYLLKVSGAKISLNGTLYDNFVFIPKNNLNTMKIISSVTRNYLGTFTFRVDSSNGTSRVMPINTLYIENYLKGVVGKEMSDSFPIEALKAQAIAARNYTLNSVGKHVAKYYNLCDTIDCQVYGGNDTSLKNVIAAVDATKGMLLLSGTSIVEAYYSASDGGYTEACENVWSGVRSYFKAKPDSFDMDYPWTKTYTNNEINNLFKLKLLTNDTFVKIDMSTITKFTSGRIKNISLVFKNAYGVNYTLSYGKEAARTFLYLNSALYNVKYNATLGSYCFDGKGNGHGIGMSQIGARNRAKAGQSFENILKFYYDGSTIVNVLPSIKNISVDKSRIYSFDYPCFNVDAAGGSLKGLSYQYVVVRNNITLQDSGYINSSKFQYKPREAGSYSLKVYVKGIDSILPYEATKTYNFNVEASNQADVNLDKTVDVFDFVIISRNMGKQRGAANWNERWNVEDRDAVINILDLAKASKNYK